MTVICLQEKCTGCQACVKACPANCIQMKFDLEGFLYPEIDETQCTECGLCREICPALHHEIHHSEFQQSAFACWHKDSDIQYSSSSGGFFTAMATQILREDGVVFGAAYDDGMYVRHIGVETEDELKLLRGSKYVQSDVLDTYVQVQQCLKQGRKVLYSGTPCQIAGLYAVVGRNYENLLTCDFVCHGVPSPKIFQDYVCFVEKKYEDKLISVKFRDKRIHWGAPICVGSFGYGRTRCFTNQMDRSFYQVFIDNVVLRPACYQCPYVGRDRMGDLTFADFWEIADKKISFKHDFRNGISKVLVNNRKGERWFHVAQGDLYFEQRLLEDATHVVNLSGKPSFKPRSREKFFEDYQQFGYAVAVKKYFKAQGWKPFVRDRIPPRLMYRIRNLIKSIIGE